jgi:hypothetical protein
VNRRALGCAAIGIVVFVGIGLFGMSLAFNRLEGCPDRLQYFESGYLPVGTPAPSPGFPEGEPAEIGSTFIGLTTRTVWGPPGSKPSRQREDLPDTLILDCADGSYQTYRLGTDAPASPGASG